MERLRIAFLGMGKSQHLRHLINNLRGTPTHPRRPFAQLSIKHSARGVFAANCVGILPSMLERPSD
jgi:hypothetical protein